MKTTKEAKLSRKRKAATASRTPMVMVSMVGDPTVADTTEAVNMEVDPMVEAHTKDTMEAIME